MNDETEAVVVVVAVEGVETERVEVAGVEVHLDLAKVPKRLSTSMMHLHFPPCKSIITMPFSFLEALLL